ncbi:MAG: glycosyltransferase family 2 protein [Alphaproteobacteria bacterium]|nr:glycosyltransferase family 2 protein [Alphaproteobacteria bacterium]
MDSGEHSKDENRTAGDLPRVDVSVVMITRDASAHLGEVLDSVRGFPEVVVLDNGSTDATLDIAAGYPNVRIEESAFIGFGPLKNKAIGLASHDWILSLDSDEVLSRELADEILSLDLDPSKVYALPFHNYFRGRWIRGCGWHPQWKTRLFHRRHAKFSDDQVHEGLRHPDHRVVRLLHPVRHYTADSVADFQAKERLYSELYVAQHAGEKRVGVPMAVAKGGFAFLRSYFLQRGILCGADGFIISAHAGIARFYRYLKLREANLSRD